MNTPSPTSVADVLLRDGSIATIRPMTQGDEPGLLALHDSASENSIRMRFFSINRAAGHDYVEHLVSGTRDPVLTLVAVVHDRIVGVASAEGVSPDTAEVAFLVSDSQHGRGVGSLLLEHLAAACRARGIRRFVAEVLSENDRMLRVFADAGFQIRRVSFGGVMSFEISTSPTASAVRAADLREFQAEARSLHPLLYPSTVAVVGVRRNGGGIGHGVLESIVRGGFGGSLYVVHPRARRILDVPCVRSLQEVREHVDLLVIAVPALEVVTALQDAAKAGVTSAVVIASGFGELGQRGRELQQEILRIARDNSIRLVGPNCLGVLSNDPGVRLNATFSRVVPPAGGLAIASQSGGVGIAMLDLARDLGLGVHTFVSLGNKADVSGNDLLAAWYDDDHVTAAALYLESFGNALKFARIAQRFAERKPLLAVVGGRSSGGVRAGASHTAAAAAPTVGVEALFAQAGVIACRSAETMSRTALLLQQQPLPAGPRLGVVSNAGGIGVLTADAADALGLVVPQLSPGLEAGLRDAVLGTAGTTNPVDLGAGAAADHLARVLEPLLAGGEIDALLVAVVATSVTDPEPLLRCLHQTRQRHPEIPVVLVAMGGLRVPEDCTRGLTIFRSPDEAVEALALVTRYAAWLDSPRDERQPPDEDRADLARRTAQDLVAAVPHQAVWLAPREAAGLLTPYGLTPTGEPAADAQAAADAAARIGFPVVVKVADEHVVHKTDRGLVRVGLESAPEVLAAVHAFSKELEQDEVPVLVQPVVAGVEIALGIIRDPGFGPLVMVAAGGVATGLWNDRCFLLPPITRRDASRALRSLRIWPLLEGFRGSEPVDVDALEQVVCALGDLAHDVPEVAELDLNPVMATPRGPVLVDVKIRLSEAEDVDEGIPRALRSASRRGSTRPRV